MLRKNLPVDWESPDIKRIEESISFYLDIGLCEKRDDTLQQYILFFNAIKKIKVNCEGILGKIIDTVPGLKLFMIIHSSFDDEAEIYGDWLEKFMIKKLTMDENSIKEEIKDRYPPKHLLDMFKIFDPTPVLFELYPIRIEYGMWKKNKNQRIVDPINIIDTNWEKLEAINPTDVSKIIAEYGDISVPEVYDYTPIEQDDLPF